MIVRLFFVMIEFLGHLMYNMGSKKYLWKCGVSVLHSQKAYQWIASLYFFQSMPFVVVTLIGTLMYQQYGVENAHSVFLTSLLMLPWVIKPLFAPLLENISTKKRLTVFTQASVSILFLILALSVNGHYFLIISVLGFVCLALTSSLHDIASDGVYLLNLDSHDQQRYVALRTFFYQMGSLVIKGGLLVFIGQLAIYYQFNVWRVFFCSLFVIGVLLTLYHLVKLPEIENANRQTGNDYFFIFKILTRTPKLYPSLLFIFLYNFSDAQMQKIIPLFLLDKTGLDLGLAKVGEIYGIAGSLSFMLGVFLSGFLIARFSIESCMKKLTIFLLLGHLFFLLLAFHESNRYLIYATVLLSQLTVGMANGGYMGYLLSIANKSVYPMSMYTVCTAIMALSYVFFGALSGLLEQYLGYANFFFYIFMANILLVIMTYRMMNNHV